MNILEYEFRKGKLQPGSPGALPRVFHLEPTLRQPSFSPSKRGWKVLVYC